MLAVLLILINTIPVYAESLYEYYDGSTEGNWASYGSIYRGQTFTVDVNFLITKVEVKIRKAGSPGTGYLQVRNTAAGLPTTVIATSNSYNFNGLSTSYQWISLSFPSSTVLNADTKYSLNLVAPSGSAANCVEWAGDDSSPSYSGGNLIQSTNGGSSWAGYTTTDLNFKVYGVDAVLPEGIVSFDVEQVSEYYRTLTWNRSDYAERVRIVRHYADTVDSIDDEYEVYEGTAETCDDNGYPCIMPTYYTVWEWNAVGWQLIPNTYFIAGQTIEGEKMDVNINISIVLIGLIMGLVLMLFAGIFRSPILWLAAFVCFIGIYLEPEVFDTYYQVGAGIVMIFCLIMATFHYRANKYGG